MTKARILIVEDEAIIAMEIESSLQNLGYEVTSVVNNGDKALQKVEEDKPDLILMDIRIQGGKDGIDTAEVIHERFGIPVIFSTAYLDEERIERAKITMPFGYVLKPIQERDLKVTLEMALYLAKVEAEKRKADRELLESQILFSEVFEHLPVTMQLFDPDGYCIRVNAKFSETFAVREEEIIGKYNILKDENLMSPRISSLINEIFVNKKTNKWEAQFNVKISADLFGVTTTKTEEIYVETIGYPVLDSAGNLKFVVMHTSDITERIEFENKLKESESYARSKLEKIVSPEGSFEEINLNDVIDAPEIQELMDDFYQLTGIGVAILDIEGNILVKTGWQDVCTKFHRVHPLASKNCLESDTELSKGVKPGSIKMYKCKNNLWDIATPIVIGDSHLGNLFLGQFFFKDEEPDIDVFYKQAQKYGFNWDDYKSALDRVPRWSRETVNTAMSFYAKFARRIAKLGSSNIKLARLLNQEKAANGK